MNNKEFKRQRLAEEINQAIFDVISRYKIEDIEEWKPSCERNLLDNFIHQYKIDAVGREIQQEVNKLRG